MILENPPITADELLAAASPDWEALSLIDNPEANIYQTHVRPLTGSEIAKAKNNMVPESGLPGLDEVCRSNQELFASSKTIAVVLDGRSDYSTQGWLGDMVEASRLVHSLVEAGKEVVVITSQPDIFDSHEGITTIGIPAEVSSKALHPYNESLLKFSQGKADAFLFPINAYLPVLISINEAGQVANQATVDTFRNSLDPTGQVKGAGLEVWGQQKIHQLQALQVLSEMIGITAANSWDVFPSAYIHPDANSQFIAGEVIKMCQVNAPEKSNPEAFPLFVHIGTATDHNKINSKFYPEAQWQEFLNLLAEASVPISELFFFRPIDQEQLEVAQRLVTQAQQLKFNVTEIPMSEIQEKYGWTLGAFAAFLSYIQEQKGMMLGVDSLPAGHLAPALGIPSVVLGNKVLDPSFFCPQDNSLVVLPTEGDYTAGIEAKNAVSAVKILSKS